MAIKSYRPLSNASRGMTAVRDDAVTSTNNAPLKSSLRGLTRVGPGRNNAGRITMFQRGGGHKRLYRAIDFKRDKEGVIGKVTNIEYDPNRSASIALIAYADGDKRYILAPVGLKVGSVIQSGKNVDILPGNCLPLISIPVGSNVHNIELKPNAGGQMVRTAGSFAQLLAKESGYAQLKMPSGEIRKVHLECRATVGQIGNVDHINESIGKAGRSRWMGRRPSVRGVAMNPVDHPHGGGEGRTSGGRHPVSPWATPTKGYKTRKNKRTRQYILKRRKG